MRQNYRDKAKFQLPLVVKSQFVYICSSHVFINLEEYL